MVAFLIAVHMLILFSYLKKTTKIHFHAQTPGSTVGACVTTGVKPTPLQAQGFKGVAIRMQIG